MRRGCCSLKTRPQPPHGNRPFGGAATCIGRRHPRSPVRRSYVYAAMRISGAADPTRLLLILARQAAPAKWSPPPPQGTAPTATDSALPQARWMRSTTPLCGQAHGNRRGHRRAPVKKRGAPSSGTRRCGDPSWWPNRPHGLRRGLPLLQVPHDDGFP